MSLKHAWINDTSGTVIRVRSRFSPIAVALAVVVLLGVAGCGSEPATDAAPNDTVAQELTSPSTSAASVDAADDWASPLVGGGTFSFAQARAQGPFGMWFWAPG